MTLAETLMHLDVLCIGHTSFDLTFQVEHHPKPDEKCVATAFRGSGGGPAANAAVAIARLGYHAAFVGYLGEDIYGEQHYQEFLAAGVGTTWIVRGSAPTPLSTVLVKPDGTRSLINYRGQTPVLTPDQLDFGTLAPKLMLFDGHEPLLSHLLLKQAQAEGIPTILDAGSVHPGTEALWNQVDYLVASEKFALTFTGKNSVHAALVNLAQDAKTVVITLGEQGLVYAHAGKTGEFPAFKVQAIDTTGAGDAFHGGFAAAIAAGMDWLSTLEFASAVGALCCTRLGARPGLPDRHQVNEFLQSRSEYLRL